MLIDKLNSEVKLLNNMSNNVNELNLKNEIEIKDKNIIELKEKLARFPFELEEGEDIIPVIFSSIDWKYCFFYYM